MSAPRMPALFLGHGSPMNVLEDNKYTRLGSSGRYAASPKSDCRGICPLVYPWDRGYGNGGTENHP